MEIGAGTGESGGSWGDGGRNRSGRAPRAAQSEAESAGRDRRRAESAGEALKPWLCPFSGSLPSTRCDVFHLLFNVTLSKGKSHTQITAWMLALILILYPIITPE